MKFLTDYGEVVQMKINESPMFIGYSDNDPEGKVMDCPNLVVRMGQKFGEAACLSACNCMFCHTLRTAFAGSSQGSLVESGQTPPLRL